VSETYRARSTTEVRVDGNVMFVLKDCADATARCREAFYKNNNNKKRVYLLEGVNANNDGGWLATACDQVKKWLTYVGDPETILASSLTKPDKKIMTFKGRAWSGRANSWYRREVKSANWMPEKTLSTDLGGYYVTLEGLTPWHKDDENLDLGAIVEYARDLKIFTSTDVIWGINKTNTKLIAQNPAWREVRGHVQAELVKLINTHKIEQIMAQKTLLQEANSRVQCGIANDWHAQFGLMQNGLGAYVRQWYQLAQTQAQTVNVDAVRNLARALKVTVNASQATTLNMETEWTQIMARYPLLRHAVRSYPGDAQFQEFVDYVNLVDTVRK
jgi:hypothetical protein